MKIRPARSFERAVQQIIAGIGEEASAEAVGRSKSLIRKWSDADSPSVPSIEQAWELDRAYVKILKEPAPIHAVYSYRIGKAFDDLTPESKSIIKTLFNLHSSVADITRTLADSMQKDHFDYIELTPNVRASLLLLVESMTQEAENLERAIATN